MAQSLSQIYVHLIFHIANDSVGIKSEDAAELYAYIGGIIKNKNCVPLQIGGVPDHLHVLCVLSKNITLIKMVEEIKRNSSRWIKS